MTIRERITRSERPPDPAQRRATDRPPIRVDDQIVAWVDHDGQRHEIEGNKQVMTVFEVGNGFVKVVETFPRTQYHMGGVQIPPPPMKLIFAMDDSEDGNWHGWPNIRAAGLIRHNDIERSVLGDKADEPLPIEAWEIQHKLAMRTIPAEPPTW